MNSHTSPTLTPKRIIISLFIISCSLWLGCSINNTICNAYMNNELESTNVSASYANVAALKEANVSAGSIVKTDCFKSEGDLGGATYSIGTTAKYNHINISIPLKNGLFANLVISNRSVNVASIGILPNEDMSPSFNTLEHCLENDVDEFIFNDGYYYLSSRIQLGSFTYTGAPTTTWVVDQSFSETTYRIIRADPREWDNSSINLTVDGINFLYETHNNCPLNECPSAILAIAGCDNCTIKSCTFTAKQAKADGCFAEVALLWFRDIGTNNIQIIDSYFYNLVSNTNSTSHAGGGCLWYMGNDGETSNNITVNNCYFLNTNSDEAVCFWRGLFKQVEFNDCVFKSDIHQSDGIVGMCSAIFESLSLNSCTFQSDVSTKKHIHFYNLKPNQFTDIKIDSCSFINNNGVSNTRVPGDGDINTFIYIPACKASCWLLNVTNCTFQSQKNNYIIKSIVNMFDSPNVNCNFDSSNVVNVKTSSEQISRNYIMGIFY